MNDFKTVLYETDGNVATITLNRPDAMNAFDRQLRHDLNAALVLASGDEAIRAVVIAGAGRAFNPGADLKEGLNNESIERMLNVEYRLSFDNIINMQKPVISAVNGFAAGIGMSLALVCDLSVMADDAFLLSPFANISLVPDGGATWLLVRALGYKRAYQMAVECERMSAQDALDAGLVNRVVPAAEVLSNAQSWAAALAERAPLAMIGTKRAMRLACHASFDEVFKLEALIQGTCTTSEDATEAVNAFVEKRPAAPFKGK